MSPNNALSVGRLWTRFLADSRCVPRRPGHRFFLEAWTASGKRCRVITLLVATGNTHKVEELRAGLGSEFRVLSPLDLGLRLEPEEHGPTLAANAAIKSVAWAGHLARQTLSDGPEWVLADDSGLEVDALEGAPGVHSARYAGLEDGRKGNSTDAENNARLLRELARFPVGLWTARFRCVLALTPVAAEASEADRHAKTRWFEGVCEGRIRPTPAGTQGFGYDPLFVPLGEDRSFAELGDEWKNRVSHRARALAALRAAWRAATRGSGAGERR